MKKLNPQNKKRIKKNITYLDKYKVLQNDYLSINDLEVLNETSYEKSRQEMLELINVVKEHNQNNPNERYRFMECPYKVPKKIVLDKYRIDESYIFKKAKEELQIQSLMKGMN